MKFRLFIVIVLLGAISALPAHAAAEKQTKPNAFIKYLSTKFYEKALYETASSAAALELTCSEGHYKVKRESQNILAPVFFAKKKFHPIKGLWFEHVNVLACGKTIGMDVTVITDPEKPPEFSAALTQDTDSDSK